MRGAISDRQDPLNPFIVEHRATYRMISPTNMDIRKASVHFESKHVLMLINVRAKRHEETVSDT